MNKKGFTLVELLATLVIIAIITIIAVPKILDWFNNSTDTYKELDENLVIEAARIYVTDHPNNYLPNSNKVYCITMPQMVNYGCLDENSVKIISDKSYDQTNMKVKVTYNGNYFEYQFTNNCIAQ